MTSNHRVQIARENDLPIVQELAQKIWRTYYPEIIGSEQVEYMLEKMYSLNALSQQLQEEHQFYLFYVDTIAVGFISIKHLKEEVYFLPKFYVLTNNQNKGLGTYFLNEVLGLYPKMKEISLTVNRQNYKAINFYFKNGFVIDRVADFDIGEGYVMNDFVMKKLIE